MGKPTIPFGFEDVPTKPPMSPQPLISDDIQQVLATLGGYDGETRRLLRCTKGGNLQVVNPLASDLINLTATSGTWSWQGDDIKTNEVVVRAHPDNGGRVIVNIRDTATTSDGWPLDANEHITLTVNNLSHVRLKIYDNQDKAMVLHSL